MKKLFVLTVVGVLIASAPGCRSGRCCPWRNAGAPTTTYDGMPMPPPVYGGPTMAAPASAPPAGGCGPGCSSCGGNSPQVLSAPQQFAPGPNAGPIVGQ